MSSQQEREHLLTITKATDWEPDEPSWDWSITCTTPDRCDGWWECPEAHVVDGIDAADGPYENDCPGWHGPYALNEAENTARAAAGGPHWPWCDDDEHMFHGVAHTWRYGFGWTVPFPGCVVQASDTVGDYALDIAADHGEGVYVVEDDWDDTYCTLVLVGRAGEAQ